MPVRFDASADRLLRTANLPNYDGNYTMLVWFYLVGNPSTGTYYTLFTINRNSTSADMDAIYVKGTAGGDFLTTFADDNGSFSEREGTTGLSTGTWYYAALVRASTTDLQAYLGTTTALAAAEGASADQAVSRTAATRMEFGAFGTSQVDRFDGRVANILIYDTNLTLAEIQAQQFVMRPVRTANLHIWSPTFPGATERLADYSGNGYSWTAGGTLTDEDPPPISYGAAILRFVRRVTGGTTYEETMAGTITPAGTLVRQTGKVLAGTIAPAGALVKAVAQSLSGAVVPAGALVNQAGKVIAGSITPSGVLANIKIAAISLAGSITPAGAIVLQAGKVIAGSIAPAGAIVKAVAGSMSGAITGAGGLVKQAGKVLTGAITPSGALDAVKVALLSVAGTLTPSGALVRQTGKVLAGAVTPAGALVRQTGKVIAGSLVPAGALVKAVAQSLSGSLTPAGALVKAVAHTLAGAITPSGALSTVYQAGGAVATVIGRGWGRVVATATGWGRVRPPAEGHGRDAATAEGRGRVEPH